jgi:proteasome assembly chaperone (PAC2) family protein
MVDALRLLDQPDLRTPDLLLAFEGWNDAGEAATSAVRFLADALGSVRLAEIDPEEFFDFTVARPQVRLDARTARQIDWPAFDFSFAPGAERDVIIGVGTEPHTRWRGFCDCVLEVARHYGVLRVVLLGSYLADVLYTRPVGVTGFASDPVLMERLGIEPSGYEGPTGIVGVLGERFRSEGFEVLSIWAGLPHYIDTSPNPRGALALVQHAAPYLGVRVDEQPLFEAAAEFEQRVSALVASDPTLAEYVKQLKRRDFAQ